MKIIKINPFRQPEYVRQIAQIYKGVFEGAPWYEIFKCPICGDVYPSNCKMCENCEAHGMLINLVEYWPIGNIITDFYKQMLKKNSLCFVAIHDEKIIGFSWGHEVSVDEKLDSYLGAPKLHTHLDKETYFYLDEIGVIASGQRNGVGKELASEIFSHQRVRKIVLKTLKDSQKQRMIERMGGKTILHIPDERIIMTLNL